MKYTKIKRKYENSNLFYFNIYRLFILQKFILIRLNSFAAYCDMWYLRLIKPLSRIGTRVYGAFHDTLDHLTGIEKREMLAHLAGDCDPFRMMSIKKGILNTITYTK